ncbi:MAG: RuvX/YqgF family protein [Candidatus Peribacteraceae bacterium]|nr:RuvX/YqgF family protein [Candidatus Peribacteraceae bacterium]
MQNILALDIGVRRTGAAFADITTKIPLPLETITHTSLKQLCDRVAILCQERVIDVVVLGWPLLPSGKEGAQVKIAEDVRETLQKAGLCVEVLDERYTTPRSGDIAPDPDSAAACALLGVFLQRKGFGK